MGALITLSITEITLLLHQEKINEEINHLFLKQKYWFSIFMKSILLRIQMRHATPTQTELTYYIGFL